MLLSAFDWRKQPALRNISHFSSKWPTDGSRSPSTQLVKIASTVGPCSEIDESSTHISSICAWDPARAQRQLSGLILNSVAYVVARFSCPPILQLSAGKSHTSQMPKPVLAREESRLC